MPVAQTSPGPLTHTDTHTQAIYTMKSVLLELKCHMCYISQQQIMLNLTAASAQFMQYTQKRCPQIN